jgi:hypothetical protein
MIDKPYIQKQQGVLHWTDRPRCENCAENFANLCSVGDFNIESIWSWCPEWLPDVQWQTMHPEAYAKL